MMDHDHIAENHVVQRYLQGRLDPDEAERFEGHYLDCPECLAELRAAEGLHRGLRGVAARETAARQAAARLGVFARAARAWRRGGTGMRAAVTVFSMAALAAIAALAVTGLLWQRDLPPDPATPQAGTRIAYLSPLRSAPSGPDAQDAAPLVERPPAGGWVVLVLDLGPPSASGKAADGVRVTLTREGSAEPLWVGDDLVADSGGELAVSVPAALLEPGVYRVEVAERVDVAERLTYPFRVLAAP